MLQQLRSAAVLVAGIVCTSAHATTWNFSYQGFVDAATGMFDPARTIAGTFTGSDTDRDGRIIIFELDHLSVGGFTYRASGASVCHPPWAEFSSCATMFVYSRTGELTFDLSHFAVSDEPYRSVKGGAANGNAFYNAVRDDMFGDWREERYYWSDQTVFSITAVPEPTAALALPVGLAVLAAARRRRALHGSR